MCWISAQFPPRIIAGSCGPSTIGLASPGALPAQSPSISISSNSVALTAFFAGSKVIPHLPRTSLQLNDSISIGVDLQKNGSLLSVLPDTMAYMEVVAVNANGTTVPQSQFAEYISISPSAIPV